MSDQNLRELLARVHEQLNGPDAIDADTRELLTTVMRDIDRRLGRNAPAPGTVGAGGSATAPRLEALAVRFETRHPAIAQTLRQIGALLGQAGI